jgi:hypothetical protein
MEKEKVMEKEKAAIIIKGENRIHNKQYLYGNNGK